MLLMMLALPHKASFDAHDARFAAPLRRMGRLLMLVTPPRTAGRRLLKFVILA